MTRAGVLRAGGFFAGQAALVAGVGLAFWTQEVRYATPAEPPPGVAVPAAGATLPLDGLIAPDGRPILVHVYAPDCPCSRFNRTEMAEMGRLFGGRLATVVLAVGPADEPVPGLAADAVLADPDGAAAARLGVYATPQAVLLDPAGRLVYRGGYNRGRYCADPRTAFARRAAERLLAGEPVEQATGPVFGCPTPAAGGGGL